MLEPLGDAETLGVGTSRLLRGTELDTISTSGRDSREEPLRPRRESDLDWIGIERAAEERGGPGRHLSSSLASSSDRGMNAIMLVGSSGMALVDGMGERVNMLSVPTTWTLTALPWSLPSSFRIATGSVFEPF